MRMCLSLTRSRRLRLQAVLCTRRETQERADLRVRIVNENKMVIKTVQYVRFPGGPPPEYSDSVRVTIHVIFTTISGILHKQAIYTNSTDEH